MADIFDLFKQISTTSSALGKPEFIVAGLGNPGSEYEKTRLIHTKFNTQSKEINKIIFKINKSKF